MTPKDRIALSAYMEMLDDTVDLRNESVGMDGGEPVRLLLAEHDKLEAENTELRAQLETQRGGEVVVPEPTSDEWREIAAKAVSADLVDFLSGAAAYGLWLRGKIPQAIPADRVLADGMVGVDLDLFAALLRECDDILDRYESGNPLQAGELLRILDALRSAKGEVEG